MSSNTAGASLVLDTWAERAGFATLHDVEAPGARGHIDHIVVGAPGVAIIDEVGGRAGRAGQRAVARVRAQVSAVDELLRDHGLRVPVRGFLSVDEPGDGIPADHVVSERGGVSAGTPEAIARTMARGNVCTDEEAEAALETLAARMEAGRIRPLGELEIGAPAPVLRRPLSAMERERLPLTLLLRHAAILVCVIFATFTLRNGDSPAKLAPAKLQQMLPALRDRAEEVAGGPVVAGGIATTANRVHVSFDRGTCHVELSINRRLNVPASDVPMVVGSDCIRP